MRILVIEDEPDLRELLVEEMADLGHEVHAAANGQAGIDMVKEMRPHLICSDINMPEMNGHQFKRRLDEDGLLDPNTVFIFISANATRTDIADGLMAGAEHYFTKPVDYERLCAVLAETEESLIG